MKKEERSDDFNIKKSLFSLSFILTISLLLMLVLIPLASATLTTGNASHFIEKKYSLGQSIIGWINVSVADEDAGDVFRDSEGKQVSLIDLLRLNPGVSYLCNPTDCGKDYSADNGETTKQLTQAAGTKKYGMLFSEEITSAI